MRHRQEVLNIKLADLLCDEGLIADPETIVGGDSESRQMPDVLVDFRGLRTAIEGDFSDKPDVEETLLKQALGRVETGVARLGIAVVYPAHLRSLDYQSAKQALEQSNLRWAVVTPENDDPDFSSGAPYGLGEALRRVHEQLGRESALEKSVAILHAAIEEFAGSVEDQPAVAERFASSLGIWGEEGKLTDRQRLAVRRISGLVLENALIFQERLAESNSAVPTLQQIRGASSRVDSLTDTWRMIVTEINYYPIFHIATGVMEAIAQQEEVTSAIDGLITAAGRILSRRAGLRHDLMGRIYHRLLTEAKHLGAYYTSIPAATLLLKLALRRDAWEHLSWDDPKALSRLRFADLACGTGTLLMACADAVEDNHIRASAERGQLPQPNEVHRALLDHVLHGFDVIPSAVHLTASTLALRNPAVMVENVQLYSLKLGGKKRRLGSIDFVGEEPIPANGALFALAPEGQQAAGKERDTAVRAVQLPPLDLCVMNPPFTRSVGGNLLFGSLPDEQRKPMQERLKQLRDRHGLEANITAGLGAIFVALADRFLKPTGRMALVLPKALLNGISWTPTRDLLRANYRMEYIVTSHEPDHWNFSENTDLSEVLTVAQREGNTVSDSANTVQSNGYTVFVNLWHNPRNSVESLSLASAIREFGNRDHGSPHRMESSRVQTNKRVLGELLSVPDEIAREKPLFYGAAYAQACLVRALYELSDGYLRVPGTEHTSPVPICEFGRMVASIGPDRRDIHDGFELSPGRSEFPVLWGHETDQVTCIAQEPNAYLTPLSEAKPGRSLRDPESLWAGGGTLMIGERLWLHLTRTVAVRLEEDALSNVWWPVRLTDACTREEREKALALWLNSTPGLLLLIANRTETRGAWAQLKKPNLQALPVLNVEELSGDQLDLLSAAYDRLADEALAPLPAMEDDEVRAEFDHALEEALGLPTLAPLRRALSWEPVMCLTMDRLLARESPDAQCELPL